MSIKEKLKNMGKNILTFAEEHPELTAALLFGGILGGCAIAGAVRDRKDQKYIHEGLERYLDKIQENERKKEEWKLYEDNWNLVNEFAKHIKLLPGEMFVLEDPEQYRDCTDFSQVDFSMPIVSHLVWNEGVYPPEG